MKNYIIQRTKDGLLLICESLNKKGQVEKFVPSGPFEIGDASRESLALAAAIMTHYFGSDAPAQAEVRRKTLPFLNGFLGHHKMALGATYEISSDVIDRWASLL